MPFAKRLLKSLIARLVAAFAPLLAPVFRRVAAAEIVQEAWQRSGCLLLPVGLVLDNTAIERMAAALAPIVNQMARTGAGTDECLKRGALPLPVHYYSPVPDLKSLDARDVWTRRSDLPGIEFRLPDQLTFLRELGREFGEECDWPSQPTGRSHEFYTENNTFSYSCAAPLHCLIRREKPRRIFEVGSGNSSLVISAALTRNAREQGAKPAEYTIVDPFPNENVQGGLERLTNLVEQPVESLPLEFFSGLDHGDLLFIDSGHTVRMGGDVNFLFLEVLPRLRSGVIIHIHDIPLPGEYARVYATNPMFRVFWTEAYLLQAFLCYNSQFQVLLGMSEIMAQHRHVFREAYPHYDPERHLLTSQSFWMRRQ